MSDNPDAAFEQALRLLSQRGASSEEHSASGKALRVALRKLDEVEVAASQRRANVLTIVPTDRISRLGDVVGPLETLDAENRRRAMLREVGASFADQLDARIRDAEQAEAAQAWARSPFATYETLAKRAVELLVTDVTIRRLARNAYLQVPRPLSAAIGYELGDLPRMIATSDVLSSMILPRFSDGNGNRSAHNFWPPRSGSYDEALRSQSFEFDADAALVAELANLSQGRPTSESVDRALAKADAVLVAEFCKVIAAIAELKARAALGRRESEWVVLPSIGSPAMAAE